MVDGCERPEDAARRFAQRVLVLERELAEARREVARLQEMLCEDCRKGRFHYVSDCGAEQAQGEGGDG